MKKNFLALGAVAMISAPAFALEVNCVYDYRAVDGPAHSVSLKVDKDGNGVATIVQQSDSPAASHYEKLTLRALTCEELPGHDLNVQCDGIHDLSISELEKVKLGGGGFSREIIVTTSLENKNFRYAPGPIGKGATKNGCEITK